MKGRLEKKVRSGESLRMLFNAAIQTWNEHGCCNDKNIVDMKPFMWTIQDWALRHSIMNRVSIQDILHLLEKILAVHDCLENKYHFPQLASQWWIGHGPASNLLLILIEATPSKVGGFKRNNGRKIWRSIDGKQETIYLF